MLRRRNVPGRFMAGNVRQRRRRCRCYRSSATTQTTFHPYARHQSGVVVRTLLDGRNFRNCYRTADLVQRMFRCALALRDSLTPTPNNPPDCDSREAMVRGRLRPSVVREVRENIQRRRIRALERPSSVGDGLNPADRHCIAAPARKCRQCPSQACAATRTAIVRACSGTLSQGSAGAGGAFLGKLVHPTGFEPVASAFGGQRSIQLSYGCRSRPISRRSRRALPVSTCKTSSGERHRLERGEAATRAACRAAGVEHRDEVLRA